MDKGQVGDIVDVTGCEPGRPGTVIRVGEVGPEIRWTDQTVSNLGVWPWDKLYLIKRPVPKEPAFELTLWETQCVLERLRRIPGLSQGPITTRMEGFVRKHETEVEIQRTQSRIHYYEKRVQELKDKVAALEAKRS